MDEIIEVALVDLTESSLGEECTIVMSEELWDSYKERLTSKFEISIKRTRRHAYYKVFKKYLLYITEVDILSKYLGLPKEELNSYKNLKYIVGVIRLIMYSLRESTENAVLKQNYTDVLDKLSSIEDCEFNSSNGVIHLKEGLFMKETDDEEIVLNYLDLLYKRGTFNPSINIDSNNAIDDFLFIIFYFRHYFPVLRVTIPEELFTLNFEVEDRVIFIYG